LSLIKKLASQTAIYGVSSIVGRFLNYLLVPIHVRIFTTADYGAVTYFYSYVSFFAILLTYGMETAFFRFYNKENGNTKVYGTSFLSLVITSLLFFTIVWLNANSIADLIKYPQYQDYVKWFAAIMALDAITAIPFAKLRMHNKAWTFAGIKLINIAINIIFNIIFLLIFPKIGLYNQSIGIGYIFLANLLASIVTLLLLLPTFSKESFYFDFNLLKKLLFFSIPLMIAGLAGMVNETFDRIALRYLLPPGPLSEHQMGVYGGCYKLAMLMTIFIQAYRFAAEPFFFGRQKEKDNLTLYAQSMNYFVAVCCFIFLGITLYMDWVKLFLNNKYFEGLSIVPVLLLANLFLGMYVNFSMWFKLSGNTKYGILFSFIGAGITLIGLFTLVPKIGYQGAAWTTLLCYLLMALGCFILGQIKYPIPYNLKKIGIYLFISFLLFALNTLFFNNMNSLTFFIKTISVLAFGTLVLIIEKSKKIVA